jgi:hypothetical protein
MAIPGAGEITPGMNMQAKKPAFEPKGDVMPIPMQPAPIKPPQSIREYLQALQAGQVPTFTNIPGQTGTFSEGQGAMAFQDIGPGAGGPVVPFPEQQGAISEGPAGDPADKPVTGNDPYQMAKQRLPHMLPNLKEEFDAKYGNKTSLEEYDQLWGQAVNHLNNELIKKYEKKIEKSEKQAIEWVGKFTKGSIKDWQKTGDIGVLRETIDVQKIAAGAKKDYDKWTIDAEGENEFDPKVTTARAMLEKYPDVNSYVMSSVEGISKAIEDHAMRQTERDQARRGGGSAPQTGAKKLPPTYEKAKAFFDEQMKARRPDGTPITPEEAWDIMLGTYPEMKPFK